MVLQASGAISFTNVQTEFGGVNPIGINEYYANSVTGYTTGVSGIPNTGVSISLNQFYGKAKPDVATVPTPVATSFTGTYTTGPGGGNTSLEWITGCSGTNLSRSDVSTFNNIGTYGVNRTNVINNMNLILQAAPGNNIRIIINVGQTNASDPETRRLYVNFGSGYTNVSTNVTMTGGGNSTHDYTIPSNTVAGNYGICCTNDYNNGNNSYTSVNYYSLHIFVPAVTGPVQKTVTLTTGTFNAPGDIGGWYNYPSPEITIPSDFNSLISWDLTFYGYKNYSNYGVLYLNIGITNVGGVGVQDVGYDSQNVTRTWTNQTIALGNANTSLTCYVGFYSYANFTNCYFTLTIRYT